MKLEDLFFYGAVAVFIVLCGGSVFGGSLLFFRATHWFEQVAGIAVAVAGVGLTVLFAWFVASMIGLSHL